MKEDWKQRVAGKDKIELVSSKAEVREKGGEAKFSPFLVKGLIVNVNAATEEDIKYVLEMCNFSITIQ